MNVRQMPLEELELLSYADIAYEILKLDKKQLSTPILFGEICKLLNINENVMFDMIGDFYTTLTTDKRFLLVDGNWDLKEFHSVKPIVDDEEEEDENSESEEEIEIEGTEDDAVVNDDDFDDVDSDMDDYEDLAIINEEDLEE